MSLYNTPCDYSTLFRMWLGFVCSNLVMIAVIFFIPKAVTSFNEATFNLFLMVWGGVSVLLAAVSLLSRNFMLKRRLEGHKHALTKDDVLSAYTSGTMIAIGSGEALVIFGITLCMLNVKPWVLFPFSIAGLGLILLNKPQKDKMDKLLQRVENKPSSEW